MKKIRFLKLSVVAVIFMVALSVVCLSEESYTTSFDAATGTYTISGTGTAPRPIADSTIKKLVVEEGITVLSGSGPSGGCTNCTVVELPDSLTDITALWCFYGWNGLTDITIPKNVKTITDNTFYNCTSLKTVTIEGPVETIPSGMFINCSKLETVKFAEGVKNISGTVFYQCYRLQDVYFPSTVESISSTAFLYANSGVTIHGTKGSFVETWCNEKGYAFSTVVSGGDSGGDDNTGDDGEEVTPVEAVFSFDESTKTLEFTDGTYIAEYEDLERPWIQYAEECVNIVVGEGIISVGNNAFKGFTVLERASMPESLKDFGAYVFYGCSSLKEIDMPASLSSMGAYAFYGCSLLTDVVIPTGIASIGNYAFEGCISLSEMYIPDGVKTVGTYAFSGCTALESVRIPASLTTLGDYCFYNCNKISKVDIADIGAWCQKFTFYTLSPGIRYNNPIISGTGVVLYQNGQKVDTLVIPEGTTVVNAHAFDGLKSITSIQFPSTLSKIDYGAFSGCSGLLELDFPESLKTLGGSSFKNCTNLTRIAINSAINYTATYNFDNCPKLKRIDIGNLEEYLKMSGYGYPFSFGADMYIGGEIVTQLVIPESITSLSGNAIYGCTSIKSVVLHEGIKSIPNSCFLRCVNLETINLHEGITSIGVNSFSGCKALKTINIPASVTSIDIASFIGCTSLESITVSEGNENFVNDEFGALYNTEKTILYAYPKASENKSYVIPSTVTTLASYTFSNCINLESITVENGNTKYSSDDDGVLYNADKTTLIQYPIGNDRTSFSIPDSVTRLDYYSFAGVHSLKELRISENVKSFNNYSFENVNAEELTIIAPLKSQAQSIAKSYGLKFVGEGSVGSIMYRYQDGVMTLYGEGSTPDYTMSQGGLPWNEIKGKIKKVVVSEGVEGLGNYLFYGCEALEEIVLHEGLVRIGKFAFGGCTSLKNIEIPDSVKTMEYAFSGCTSLSDAKLSPGAKSIANAFEACGFESITIPEGIENINSAFRNNTSLKEIYLSGTVKSLSYAFDGCTLLKKIHTTDIDSFSQITSSGDVFKNIEPCLYYNGKQITEVIIPADFTNTKGIDIYKYIKGVEKIIISEGVESVVDSFRYLKFIKYIELPSTVQTIKDSLHSSAGSLLEIIVHKDNPAYSNDSDGVLYNKEKTILMVYPCGKQVTEYTIADSVEQIMHYAFRYSTSLVTLNCPESLKALEDETFAFCSNLKHVNLSEGITRIGGDTFMGSAVEEIFIPQSVTRIDFAYYGFPDIVGYEDTYAQEYAKMNGRNFKSLGMRPGIIDYGYFGENDSLMWKLGDDYTIYITGKGEIPDYENTSDAPWYSYTGWMPSVVIHEGVTKVGKNAFGELIRAENVIIPSSVTEIGENAFDIISGNFTILGFTDGAGIAYAVENNIMYKEIMDFGRAGPSLIWTLSNDYTLSIFGVGYMTYWRTTEQSPWYKYKSEILNVEIGHGVKDIGAWSLSGCSALKKLIVPDTVEHIQDYSLNGCTSLTELTIPFIGRRRGEEGNQGSVLGSVFGFIGVSGEVGISGGISQRYSEDREKDSFIAAYVPSSLKKVTVTDEDFIPYGAFYNCQFDEIVLPDDITHISPYAFYNCTVDRITIPRSVSKIGHHAFKNSELVIDYEATEAAWELVDVHSTNVYGSVVCNNVSLVLDSPEVFVTDIYGGKAVSISAVEGAKVFYTLDGSLPTVESNKYNGTIKFDSVGEYTISAIAVKTGYDVSVQTVCSFTIEKLPAPVASLESGIINGDVTVTFTSNVQDAEIRYTVDRTSPDNSSYLYTDALTVSGSTYLRAVSMKKGYVNSDEAVYYYTDAYAVPVVSVNTSGLISKNLVYLDWKVENESELGLYEVYVVYYKNSSPEDVSEINAGRNTNICIEGLAADTDYCCYIRIINGDKTTDSDVLEFKTRTYDVPLNITLDREGIRIPVGRKYALNAEIYPAAAKNKDIIWKSSDKSVAIVDKNGIVTTKSAGRVTITATSVESEISDSIDIVVFDKYVMEETDLSELNLATNTQKYAIDGFTFPDNREGGNEFMALAYYIRWDGVVSEANDKNLASYASSEYGYQLEDYYVEKDADYHLQNAYILSARSGPLDNDEIKEAIYKYGAVATAMLVNEEFFHGANNENYYYNLPWNWINSNHAVTIVGWDDNYPAENFGITPPGDGAFIVKNSWGENDFDDGFLYVSYYDTHIARWSMSYVFPELEVNNNYNNIWQYDFSGPSYKLGYKGTTYAANVFPADGRALANNELLKAVSFHTVRKNTSYEIYIIEDYTGTSNLSNLGTPVKTGMLKNMGYHTVELSKDILLKKGTRFGVIVRLIADDDDAYANMLIEKQYDWNGNMIRFDNVGFVSHNGIDWSEVDNDTNVCIKAFTDFADVEKAISCVYSNNETVPCEHSDGDIDNAGNANIMGYHVGGMYADMVDSNISNYESETELPTRYDLRDNGLTTPARNQGGFGICWTFAANASLESGALTRAKNGSLYSMENPIEEEDEPEIQYPYVTYDFGTGVAKVLIDSTMAYENGNIIAVLYDCDLRVKNVDIMEVVSGQTEYAFVLPDASVDNTIKIMVLASLESISPQAPEIVWVVE